MENYYITRDYRGGFLARKARYQRAVIRQLLSRILNRTTGGGAVTSTLIALTIIPLTTTLYV